MELPGERCEGGASLGRREVEREAVCVCRYLVTLTVRLILRLMVGFSPFININHAINMKKKGIF